MCFLFFSGDKDSRPDWMIVSASESALGLGGPSGSSSESTGFSPLLPLLVRCEGDAGATSDFLGDDDPEAVDDPVGEDDPVAAGDARATAPTPPGT